ncbi:hypothetical protein T484DRAFT_1854568 [Baffinella frigidus]|nr:hypothetical protein T484DRAFT_1854568 [Cryptophyta sp. CCMP2293]
MDRHTRIAVMEQDYMYAQHQRKQVGGLLRGANREALWTLPRPLPAQKSQKHAHEALSPQHGGARKTQHDLLRTHARQRLSTPKPDLNSPHHRHVCAECASHAHSGDTAHQAVAADTREHVSSNMRRSQSAEPLSQPAPPMRVGPQLRKTRSGPLQNAHSARRLPVDLPRAQSLRTIAPGLRTNSLKTVAYAVMATFPMKLMKHAPRELPVGDHNLAVTKWETLVMLGYGGQRPVA